MRYSGQRVRGNRLHNPRRRSPMGAQEDRMPPLLEVRELHTEFRTGAGVVRAVDGISYTVEAGETVAIVGEIGLGQVGRGAVDHAADPQSAGPDRVRRGAVRRPRPAQADRGGDARGARPRHRHGVPGADDLAQSGADHRPADHRDAGAAPGRRRARTPTSARSSCWRWSASPIRSGGSGNTRTSSPAACASA